MPNRGVFILLKLEDIQALIQAIDQSSLDEFIYEHEGSKIKLRKKSNHHEHKKVMTSVSAEPEKYEAVSEREQIKEQENHSSGEKKETIAFDHEILSPMVGTFYHSSTPDSAPFVSLGDKVNENTVVCIVEAMKLFNEIEADVEGEVVEILAENGELVEYGQPLFRVKTK